MDTSIPPLGLSGDGFSAEIGELAAALAKAQGAMRPAAKDAKNPHLKNAYADLNGIITASRDAMAANGLSCTQLPSVESGDNGMRIVLVTLVLHTSGQWLRNVLRLPVEAGKGINLKQATGAAISYARRYALSSIMGVATGDDTDGAIDRAAPSVDAQQAHRAGADAGRRWMVRQMLSPARPDYSAAAFAAQLKSAAVEYPLDRIKLYALLLGRDKPSRCPPDQRAALIKHLASPPGVESWAKFEQSITRLNEGQK